MAAEVRPASVQKVEHYPHKCPTLCRKNFDPNYLPTHVHLRIHFVAQAPCFKTKPTEDHSCIRVVDLTIQRIALPQNAMNTADSNSAYARLRKLVGFLGSQPVFSWWDSNLMSETGLRFLLNSFPRSAESAAFNATCEGARRLHDQELGRIGCYHLFRLPLGVEDMLDKASGGVVAGMTQESAMADLAEIADARIVAPAGPVQIGVEKKILTETSVQELAAHYHSAFAQGIRCYPYFSADS